MDTDNLLKRLEHGPVLADGGMGTQLIAAGLAMGECGVLWNLKRPDAIADIHTRYCRAGCSLITTNTFQGSPTALAMHGLADQAFELNKQAAVIARQVADQIGGSHRPLVMADIGPFGGFLEPLGETTETELISLFELQLRAMAEGGADGVIVETMSDAAELSVAVKTARSIAAWPIIASFTFEKSADGKTFHTMMGLSPQQAMQAAIDAGADIVGSNCGTSLSLEDYLRLAKELADATGKIDGHTRRSVMLQPNAGAPTVIDGRTVHPATPQQMAAIMPDLLAAGIRVIGGCCGTTPDHLHAMAQAVLQPNP